MFAQKAQIFSSLTCWYELLNDVLQYLEVYQAHQLLNLWKIGYFSA